MCFDDLWVIRERRDLHQESLGHHNAVDKFTVGGTKGRQGVAGAALVAPYSPKGFQAKGSNITICGFGF